MFNWLLPSKIGRLQIYSERILSICLDFNCAKIVLVKISSFGTVVEFVQQYNFEYSDSSGSKKILFEKEWLRQVLDDVFKIAASFDELRILIPAYLVVCKEILVPFLDVEKIRRILLFEIEPYIIFDATEVSVDFLLTETFPDGKANVVTSVLRDSDCVKLVTALKKSNQICNNLGVDSFVSYELIRSIIDIQKDASTIVFLEIGSQTITLGFIEKLSLKIVRVFDSGLFDLLKIVQKETGKEPSDIFDYLVHSGIDVADDDAFVKILKEAFLSLFKEVLIAIDALCINASTSGVVDKIVLFEGFIVIKDLEAVVAMVTGIRTELFMASSWVISQGVSCLKNKDQDNLDAFVKPLGFAILPSLKEFNIGYKLFPLPARKVLSKQILFAGMLLFFCFGYFFYFGYLQLSNLENIIAKKELAIVNLLKELQPPGVASRKKVVLKTLMTEVSSLIEKKESIQNESSCKTPDFLVILLELTRLLDRTRFGVVVKSLSIKPDKDKSFEYKIYVQGIYDQTKSSTEIDNFASFSRVLNLSRRLVLLELKQEESASTKSNFGFSLVLGLGEYENHG